MLKIKIKNLNQYLIGLVLITIISFFFYIIIVNLLVDVYFPKINTISLISMFLFMIVLIIGALEKNLYTIMTPFVLLAFPTAVNNFWPSFYIGSPYEWGAALIPFINHIDIYLLMGLLVHGKRNTRGTNFDNSVYLVILIFLITIYYLYSIGASDNLYSIAILSGSGYHLRFFLYFILFIFYFPELFRVELLTKGIAFSVIFLLIEAEVYTYINQYERLISGSLGNNAFANIVMAITVYLTILDKQEFSRTFYYVIRPAAILSGLFIIIESETRIAFIGLLFSFFVVILLIHKKYHWYKKIFIITVFIIFIILIMNVITHSERYMELTKIVIYYFSTGELIEDKPISTLETRFILNQASIEMIKQNPWFGIGIGRWNELKGDYGVHFDVFLDPHNGYLAFISQYGIPLGLLLLYIYLLKPAYSFIWAEKKGYSNNVYFLGSIPFSLLIPELTNAASFKIGIAGLLALIAATTFFTTLKTMRHGLDNSRVRQ